jgi:hypothetical protein
MNQNLKHDFMQKIKHNVEELNREIIGTKIDTKEAFAKIKSIRESLFHLYNLLKMEDSLEKDH